MACNTECSGPDIYYVGDEGTALIVDVCSDISTATAVSLKITKPDGTTATWSGSVYETQYIRYVVVAGDFDQPGEYRVQAYIEMPAWSGHGNTTTFKVTPLFQ